MAENGRVHPQCVNAANPYHECGVACLEKISQGKGRKLEKKKDSRNGIKQGEHSKKMVGERRINANCPKASNPFHECGVYCPNRTAETNPRRIEKDSGSFISSLSFGRKKKGSESRPNSPHLKNNYDSDVKAVYPADALSPRSPFSNGKKIDSDKSQSFSSSQQHSEDSYCGHNSLATNGRARSSESVRTPGSESRSDSLKSPSKVSLAVLGIPSPTEQEEEDEEEEKLHDSPRAVSGPLTNYMGKVPSHRAVKSMNFTFSGISYATEASDEEDVRSVISESCVSVGKYHVRANVASVLEMIIEKYGDIAANCRLESASLRGFYLECLCSVVQELQSTPFEKLTKSKLKEMLAVLKDVESAQIDVTWLCGILNELTEAMDIKTTEAAKANCDNAIESTKKELETMLKDLAVKEKAVSEANEQIAETRRRLSELQLEASRLSDAISSIQPRIEKFSSKPLSEAIF